MTESLELVVNSRQALSALKELNQGLTSTETTAEGANAKLQASYDKLEKFLVSSTDRQTKALERHIEAIDKQAAAYNRTPIERLNAMRDREIQKIQQTGVALSEQTAAINRVNAAYAQMIATETAASTAATANTRQVTAMERALETGTVSNNRAAAAFLLNIKGIGPALSTAFAVFSAVAFLGIIVQIGEAVHKWFKEMEEAPRRIQSEYEDLFSTSTKANDALETTNIKLANQIAKLEHKPQNLVKEALLEAKKAADDLADSLEKDNEKIVQFLEKNEHGLGGSFMGIAPTTELTEQAKKYQNTLIDIRYKGAAGKFTPEQVMDEEKKAAEKRRRELEADIKQTEADIKRANWGHENNPVETSPFYAKYQYEKYALGLLGPEEKKIVLTGENAGLQGQLPKAEAAAKSASVTERLQQEVSKAQQGELDGLDKINEAYDERIRHLKEEGTYNETNLKLSQQIRDAEIERFNKENARQVANAQASANSSVSQANLRGQVQMFQAQRRWSGAEFGETDINNEFDLETKIADKQHTDAEQHIADLEAQGKKEEAKLAAIAEEARFTNAKNEIERRQIIELGDLDKKRHDDADKFAKAEIDNAKKLADTTAAVQQKGETAALQYQIKLRQALGHSTVGGEKQTIYANEQDRLAMAELQYRQAQDRLDAERKSANSLPNGTESEQEARAKRVADINAEGIKATGDRQLEIDEAHRQYTLETIALWNKQYDEIKGKTEGLLHTLFTNPQGFGSQLKTTVRDAALKPIEDKLSSTIADHLQTILHGGKPGMETKLSDLKGIGKVDDSLKVHVTNLPGGGGGNASPQSLTQAMMNLPMNRSSMGLTGLLMGLPSFGGSAGSGGSFSDNGAAITSGLVGDPSSYSTVTYPGAGSVTTPPFIGDWGGSGGSGGAGGFGGIGGILGGKSPSPNGGGLDGLLKGIGGAKGLGSLTRNSAGKITGVGGMAGAALFAGGTMLAENGLMGKNAGTWGGVAEGTAGGAMIGMQLGGPLGAAIGAAAGFGIGIGEKIAGVESQQAEAKRLVKQIYHVNIDGSMADQIVSLAKSKYANHVSIAVQDPDVRKMLELYAAGTGQKMPMSSTTPHSASLVEQGGNLFQAPTYQFGQAYTFQSSLPVAGGLSSGTYPNPGGNQPMSLSINVGGKGAGDFLAGNVVTPEFVQAQWGSAAQSSNGRVANSAMSYSPGLIVS